MFNLINQNSLVIVFVLLSIIFNLLIGKHLGYKWTVFSTVISIIFISGLLFLTSTKNSKLDTIDNLNLAFTKNGPILIYVYSDWWLACTAAKPAVSRLETNLSNECRVLRVDVKSSVGKHIWNEYNVRSVPTFILFINQKPVWRTVSNVPNPNIIREKIANDT